MNAIHWIAVLAGALASGLPQIEAGLPASWAPWLGGLRSFLTLLVTVLVPLTPQAKGFLAKLTPPAAGVVLGLGIALATAPLACVNGKPTPQTVQDVTVGLNAAICVITTFSTDINAGRSEGDAIADAAIKCGVSLVQATGILDAHKKGEVLEGFVPKPAAHP